LWRCSIYNTDDCKKFDPDWYADALSISQKLNGSLVPGKKKFDVDRDLPNYFDEVEKVVTFADTKFVVDEKFIETCLPCAAQKCQYQFLMEVYQSAKITSFTNLVRRFLLE